MENVNTAPEKKTLHQAVARLESLSWSLNAKLYGERAEKDSGQVPVADSLTGLLERIAQVNSQLEQIDHALNVIK